MVGRINGEPAEQVVPHKSERAGGNSLTGEGKVVEVMKVR